VGPGRRPPSDPLADLDELELAPLGGADEAPRPRTPSVEPRTRTLSGAPAGPQPATPTMPSVALADAEIPEEPKFPRPSTPPSGTPAATEPRARTPSRSPLKGLADIVETRRLRTPRDSGLVIRTRAPSVAPPIKAAPPPPEPAPAPLPVRKRLPSAVPVSYTL
jgi:hypothetical protein